MPGVAAIDSHMKSWAAKWAKDRSCTDYYRLLWRNLEEHYSADPSAERSPNFEVALGAMIAIAHWLEPAPHGDPLRTLLGIGRMKRWRFPIPKGPFTETSILNDQATALLQNLSRFMRGKSAALDTTSSNFLRFRALAEALRNSFEIGIYNLNYDTVALNAFKGLFYGFTTAGLFDAAAVHTRTSWDFIYHLHGNVHHSLSDVFGETIKWQDLASPSDDGRSGLSPQELSQGKSFPRTTLIAGGFKLDQLLIEPYQSFYSSLVRHAASADAILIAGYGFGDEHVNRVLRNRLRAAEPLQRPPVAVATYSDDKTGPMQIRNDSWAHSLKTALQILDDFVEPGHVAPPIISDLRRQRGFEVAPKSRVAIWHGGFPDVYDRANDLMKWMSGNEPDDVLRSLEI